MKPGTDREKLWRWIAFTVLLTGGPLALAAMFMGQLPVQTGGRRVTA
jgi:hypothetical protein